MNNILIFGPTSEIAIHFIRLAASDRNSRFIFVGRSRESIKGKFDFLDPQVVLNIYEIDFNSSESINSTVKKICSRYDVSQTLIFLGARGPLIIDDNRLGGLCEFFNVNCVAVIGIILTMIENCKHENNILYIGSINSYLGRADHVEYAVSKRISSEFIRLISQRFPVGKCTVSELVLGPVAGGMNRNHRNIPFVTIDLITAAKIINEALNVRSRIIYSSLVVSLICKISRALPRVAITSMTSFFKL